MTVAALTSSCVSIPADGPVVGGPELRRDPGPLQQIASGPGRDDSPSEIVSGFLGAGVDFRQGHAVARSYLTADQRARWSPNSSVVIYPDSFTPQIRVLSDSSSTSDVRTGAEQPGLPQQGVGGVVGAPLTDVPYTPSAKAVVQLRLQVLATVDDRGALTEASADTWRTLRFELRQEEGQWRIAKLDNGLALSWTEFSTSTTYMHGPLYFVDVSGRYLVPDVRWFPRTVDTISALPSVQVSALLGGPTRRLTGAVTSGAPAGTRRVDPVVVDKGVATVNLSLDPRSLPAGQSQMLQDQLLATLAEDQVKQVKMVLAPGDSDLGGGSTAGSSFQDSAALPTGPQVKETQLLLLDGHGRLATPTPAKALPVASMLATGPVSGLPGLGPGVQSPAVSLDGTMYAALASQPGSRVLSRLLVQVRGSRVARTLIEVPGQELTRPSFDVDGWVWSAPRAFSGQVFAADLVVGRVPVRVAWLSGGWQVLGLRISRDGTQAALAVRGAGGDQLFVCPVLRRQDGRPTALGPAVRVAPRLSSITDLAWTSDDELVVLGTENLSSGSGGPVRATATQVWSVPIGQVTVSMGIVADAVSVTAGNASDEVYLGTSDGRILARSGSRWTSLTIGGSPALPG